MRNPRPFLIFIILHKPEERQRKRRGRKRSQKRREGREGRERKTQRQGGGGGGETQGGGWGGREGESFAFNSSHLRKHPPN